MVGRAQTSRDCPATQEAALVSVACFSEVMRLRLADPTEKLVLLAFAEHCNEDGLTFPSVDLVAAESLCSARTVQRIIKRFVDLGLLRLHRRASGRGYPTCYRVDPWAIGPVPEYGDLRQAQRSNSHSVPDRTLAEPDPDDTQQDLLPVDNSEKGDTLVSPFSPTDERQKGDTDRERGDRSGLMGDTRVSPEPITSNHKERDKSRPVDKSLGRLPAATSNNRRRRSFSEGAGSSSRHRPHQAPPGPAYHETLEAINEQARLHAIGPRKKWEDERAWRNTVHSELRILAIQTAEARRLNIDGRRRDETVNAFDRRVSNQAMQSEGMASSVPWEKAREQAIGRK